MRAASRHRVVRTERDPKPEPARPSPKVVLNLGNRRKKHKQQGPKYVFRSQKPARSLSAPEGSWWMDPMSRSQFMATAARLRPDASNARAHVPDSWDRYGK